MFQMILCVKCVTRLSAQMILGGTMGVQRSKCVTRLCVQMILGGTMVVQSSKCVTRWSVLSFKWP